MENENPQSEIPKDFVIKFVHKKSTQQIEGLIRQIKEFYQANKSMKDKKEEDCLKSISESSVELFNVPPNLFNLKPCDEKTVNHTTKFTSLKPFLFPYFPTNVQKNSDGTLDKEYEKDKKKFLIESRNEHQRLLYSFQDRLLKNLQNSDEDFQMSPFQIANAQLAKEQMFPVFTQNNNDLLSNRFNNLMKMSQKETSNLLELQKRKCEMIQDQQQFKINLEKLQNNEQINPNEKFNDFSVVCPYSFLCANNSK